MSDFLALIGWQDAVKNVRFTYLLGCRWRMSNLQLFRGGTVEKCPIYWQKSVGCFFWVWKKWFAGSNRVAALLKITQLRVAIGWRHFLFGLGMLEKLPFYRHQSVDCGNRWKTAQFTGNDQFATIIHSLDDWAQLELMLGVYSEE